MVGNLGDRRRAVPLEPGGFEFALGDLPGHDDLERPLAQDEFGQVVAVVSQVLGQQAVKLVALPVEFLLQGDHPASNRLAACVELRPDRSAVGVARLHDRIGQRGRCIPGQVDPTGGRESSGLCSREREASAAWFQCSS